MRTGSLEEASDWVVFGCLILVYLLIVHSRRSGYVQRPKRPRTSGRTDRAQAASAKKNLQSLPIFFRFLRVGASPFRG